MPKTFVVLILVCSGLLAGCSDNRAEREAKALQIAREFYAAIQTGGFLDARKMFDDAYFLSCPGPLRTEEGWVQTFKDGEAKGALKFTYSLAVVPDKRPSGPNIPITIDATLTYDPSTEWAKIVSEDQGGDGFSKPARVMQFIIGESGNDWKIKQYGIKRDYSGYAR